MKYILFAFMLLAVTQSNAQTDSASWKSITGGKEITGNNYNKLLFHSNTPIEACYSLMVHQSMYSGLPDMYIKCNSDTLVINVLNKLKYIQLGTEVWEFTSPSLKKTEPIQIQRGYNLWQNFSPTTTIPYLTH